MTVRIINGDCCEVLRSLPDASVHCCVTSPPYWGLRDYGTDGQIGLEQTYGEYIEKMVEVFREVWRVLRDDGTLWLNLGDSYATGAGKVGEHPGGGAQGAAWKGDHSKGRGTPSDCDAPRGSKRAYVGPMVQPNRMPQANLKPKDLCGIPWRVAFALQADGWYLRQDIIWAKPAPMPESVTDRCTKSHEYLFLLSKSERYYFDQAAIAEPVVNDPSSPRNRWDRDQIEIPGQKPQKRPDRASKWKTPDGWDTSTGAGGHGAFHKEGREEGHTGYQPKRSGNKARKPASARGVPVDTDGKSDGAVAGSIPWEGTTRNKRSVWTVNTQPFSEAHFATFPPALIEPCILAGCPQDGVVLDPFGGAGTTGLVADRHKRDAILIELNPDYAAMAERRIRADGGMFTVVST